MDAIERAVQIDADDLGEALRRQIPPEAVGEVDAGAVDENVDAPAPRENALGRLGDGALVGDVERQRLGLAARREDLRCRLVELPGAAPAQHDLRPGLRQLHRAGATDAAAGAGDPSHFALQHALLPPFFSRVMMEGGGQGGNRRGFRRGGARGQYCL